MSNYPLVPSLPDDASPEMKTWAAELNSNLKNMLEQINNTFDRLHGNCKNLDSQIAKLRQEIDNTQRIDD